MDGLVFFCLGEMSDGRLAVQRSVILVRWHLLSLCI